MSGHIRRRVLRSGEVCYTVNIVYEGKRKQVGSFHLKKDAGACLRRTQRQIADGTYGQEKQALPTLQEFYCEWIRSKEKSLKPSTLESYRQGYRDHILPYFSNKRVNEIAPLDVQAWINELSEKELAPATVGRCYRYFRSCLKDAEDWNVIDRCPCRSINLPRSNRGELDFLDAGEIRQLLEASQEPERTLFATLAFSGLRLGEALGLAWRHVNFKDNSGLCRAGLVRVRRLSGA